MFRVEKFFWVQEIFEEVEEFLRVIKIFKEHSKGE